MNSSLTTRFSALTIPTADRRADSVATRELGSGNDPSSAQQPIEKTLGTSCQDPTLRNAPQITDQDMGRDDPAAPSEVSDERLLNLVTQGSREALGLLFTRYARLVRGVAYRVLRDPSEADDLLQDIFLLIHRLSGFVR